MSFFLVCEEEDRQNRNHGSYWDMGSVAIGLNLHKGTRKSVCSKYILLWEEIMYLFFSPALLALIVIGCITLRDQFRFSTAN